MLGIAAALALAALGVLVWRNAGHNSRPDHRGTATNALKKGTGPRKSATRKTRKKAVRAATGDPWRRGLQPWPASAGAGLPTIYYKLTHSRVSCAKRAKYGCWKVEVVTRYGCRRGVLILIGETRGGADLGAARAISRPLAPRRRAVVELDAGETNVSGDVSSIFCQTG
jgi:hypothetical protein